MNHESTETTNPAIAELLGEFCQVVTEAGRLANEGAARIASQVAASSDIGEVEALLTEAMAPAVALLKQFERDHLHQSPGQR